MLPFIYHGIAYGKYKLILTPDVMKELEERMEKEDDELLH